MSEVPNYLQKDSLKHRAFIICAAMLAVYLASLACDYNLLTSARSNTATTDCPEWSGYPAEVFCKVVERGPYAIHNGGSISGQGNETKLFTTDSPNICIGGDSANILTHSGDLVPENSSCAAGIYLARGTGQSSWTVYLQPESSNYSNLVTVTSAKPVRESLELTPSYP